MVTGVIVIGLEKWILASLCSFDEELLHLFFNSVGVRVNRFLLGHPAQRLGVHHVLSEAGDQSVRGFLKFLLNLISDLLSGPVVRIRPVSTDDRLVGFVHQFLDLVHDAVLGLLVSHQIWEVVMDPWYLRHLRVNVNRHAR